jgi:hypothetical protein
MSDANEEAKARLLKIANERGEFGELEDGYVNWWPTDSSRGGAISAWQLRTLADELDKRNAVWDAVVQTDCGPPALMIWKFEDAPEELRALRPRGGDEDWLALVPPKLVPAETDTEFWWMRWYPRSDGFVSRNKHPKLDGFEIWIGAHA